MTPEAEAEVTHHKPRNASSHQTLVESKNRVSPGESGGSVVLQHRGFGPLASRTGREYTSVVWSQRACGTLLWQPRETTALNKCPFAPCAGCTCPSRVSIKPVGGKIHFLFFSFFKCLFIFERDGGRGRERRRHSIQSRLQSELSAQSLMMQDSNPQAVRS